MTVEMSIQPSKDIRVSKYDENPFFFVTQAKEPALLQPDCFYPHS